MTEWISKTAQQPEPCRRVHAKDDEGRYFDAMTTASGGWAYADKDRYGVAAIVKFWRPNREWDLLARLYDNHGVLVTTDAEGKWICQNCDQRDVFANLIQHTETCVYRLGTEGLI